MLKKQNKTERFQELANSISDLYKVKNTAYGDSFGISVQKYGIIAALTRISDKFNRMEQLVLGKAEAGDEALTDTLLDLASYALMTVMELGDSNAQ